MMGAGMRWLGATLALGVALLVGCGGSSGSSTSASLRLMNVASGYASVDLAIDGAAANAGVGFGQVGSYAHAATTGVSTVISETGSISALSTSTRTLAKDEHYTLLVYGSTGAVKTALITENATAAASGFTNLQIMNLAPDAGAVDVYLTGSGDLLANATPTASGVAASDTVPYVAVTSATYRLRVTGAGDKNDLRLDVSGLVLSSTQAATLVLAEGTGGVLVNAALLVQQGAATPLANAQARLRVVSAVTAGAAVTANVSGSTVASAAVAPNIGDYKLVAGSTAAPVTLSVDGLAVPVTSPSLVPGGDYTLLVWGDAAAPHTTLVADDNRYATVTGAAKMRLINGTTGASVPLTLKADFSVVAQSVAQGQASDYANVAASTAMRLDVSSPTNAAVYSLTDANIVAKGVYTIYLLGDAAAPVADLRKLR